MVTSSSTNRSSGPGGKAARTRRLLQCCTLDVIAETGEFTGEVVADRAGVSIGTFYSHFATKDHAIEACLAVCFEEYEKQTKQVESIEHLLDAGLEATLAAIVATITRLNGEYRGLLRLARARIQASHLLREQSRTEERRAFAATLRLIQLGQAAGRIRAGEPEVLTATVRTVLDGLDTWTIRAHPEVASREIPELLTRYLSPSAS
ncbi:TetR/AcrR family transcriptional regulator [Streptomyces sp. NPDC002088]|uniref:TetR/AcrR family transcriptional regulator n=1 Tax=Streptomyces sp. NPDC002088 TaxID=3154665 RepID=UPI00331962F7